MFADGCPIIYSVPSNIIFIYIVQLQLMFGPVTLGLTDVMRLCPALLGCVEEDLDEASMLGGLQDGIPMYQRACRNKALEIKVIVSLHPSTCIQSFFIWEIGDIKSRLSRTRQLGGLVPVVRLGVPLKCKAFKLPTVDKERTLV